MSKKIVNPNEEGTRRDKKIRKEGERKRQPNMNGRKIKEILSKVKNEKESSQPKKERGGNRQKDKAKK